MGSREAPPGEGGELGLECLKVLPRAVLGRVWQLRTVCSRVPVRVPVCVCTRVLTSMEGALSSSTHGHFRASIGLSHGIWRLTGLGWSSTSAASWLCDPKHAAQPL